MFLFCRTTLDTDFYKVVLRFDPIREFLVLTGEVAMLFPLVGIFFSLETPLKIDGSDCPNVNYRWGISSAGFGFKADFSLDSYFSLDKSLLLCFWGVTPPCFADIFRLPFVLSKF